MEGEALAVWGRGGGERVRLAAPAAVGSGRHAKAPRRVRSVARSAKPIRSLYSFPAQCSIDGAFFGSTFPHLLLMTYPMYRPPRSADVYTPRRAARLAARAGAQTWPPPAGFSGAAAVAPAAASVAGSALHGAQRCRTRLVGILA